MCVEFDDIVFTSPSRPNPLLKGRDRRNVRARSAPACATLTPECAVIPKSRSATIATRGSDVAISEEHCLHSDDIDLADMLGVVSDDDSCTNIGTETEDVASSRNVAGLAEHPMEEFGTLQQLPQRSLENSEESTFDKSPHNLLSNSDKLRCICLEYSVDQLEVATDGFRASRRLGSGSCGTVYHGKVADGSNIAVKVITLKDKDVSGFEEEIITLSKFRHPNLVVLMGWAQSDSGCYLVYEFLAGGSFQQRLRASLADTSNVFLWNLRISVACDAATGLAHLHNMRPRAFHRDVKSANILLGSGGDAKLGDFGLSCVAKSAHDDDVTCEVVSGTPGYACPIYVQSGIMKESSEVYSFGVVLYEMLFNLPPAERLIGEIVFPLHYAIRPALGDITHRCIDLADSTARFPQKVTRKLTDLAFKCTHLEERQRPCFTEACCELREILEGNLACDAEDRGFKVRIVAGTVPPPFTLVCIKSCCLSQAELGRLPRSSCILEASCTQARLCVGLANDDAFWYNLLPDPRYRSLIAEEHFEVSMESNSICLRNLASSGTLLNGIVVHDKEPLKAGSVIDISGCLVDGNEHTIIVSFRFETGAVPCLSVDTDDLNSTVTTVDTASNRKNRASDYSREKLSLPECASLICCMQ